MTDPSSCLAGPEAVVSGHDLVEAAHGLSAIFPCRRRWKNRKTFEMPRKIDAAGNGAEVMSWVCRSR